MDSQQGMVDDDRPPEAREVDNSALVDRDTVQANDRLYFLLPRGELRPIRVPERGAIGLGKYGSFPADEIIGKPFGYRYEVYGRRDGHVRVLPPEQVQSIEEETATNRELQDEPGNQAMTNKDISELKKEHTTAREVIEAIRAGNRDFDKKTQYAKLKYLRRKQSRHGQEFTPLAPNLVEVAEHMLSRDSSRVLDMTPDALGFMMTMANVQPGGSYLVVDDTGGLLTGAVLERIGCEGHVCSIYSSEHPNLALVDSFDLRPYRSIAELERAGVLSLASWIMVCEPEHAMAMTKPAYIPPDEEIHSERFRARMQRKLENAQRLQHVLDRLALPTTDGGGAFSSLLAASVLEPMSYVPLLLPRIELSATFSVYAVYREMLSPLNQALASIDSDVLSATLHEIRHREWQTLDGRRHPTMNMPGASGYVLTGIRVQRAQNVIATGRRASGRPPRKRAKP